MFEKLDKVNFETFCIVSWNIWWEHVDSQREFIKTFTMEYRDFMQLAEVTRSMPSHGSTKWSPPHLGTLRMNTDGIVVANSSFIEVVLVFRNHHGSVLAVCSKRLMGCF